MHRQLKYLIVMNSFFVFAINLFAPLYALYVQELTDIIQHVGSIWGLYIALSGVLVLMLSRFENHREYADYFLILGFIFRALGWTGYIFASEIWHLYAIQVLLAIGQAAGTPSFNMLYSVNLDKGIYATEWGIWTAISSFIMGLGAITGSWIVGIYGFTALFVIMILLSGISTVLGIKYRSVLGAGALPTLSHVRR